MSVKQRNASKLACAFATSVVLLLGCFVVTGNAGAQGQTTKAPSPSKEEVENAFEERVFMQTPGSPSDEYIVKWTRPIRIALIYDRGAPVDIVSKLASDVAEIQRNTSHDIGFASQGVNFLIIFSKDLDGDLQTHGNQITPFFTVDGDYQSFFAAFRSAQWSCGNKILVGSDRAIAGVLLIVSVSPDHNASDVSACMHGALMSGVGVSRQKLLGQKTFLLAAVGTDFSALDKALLKILYDPSLQAGASAVTVKRKISEIYSGQ